MSNRLAVAPVAALLACLAGCQGSSGVDRAEQALAPPSRPGVERVADDGGPVEFKKRVMWQALRGLDFTADGVSVDAQLRDEIAAGRGVDAAAGLHREADALLVINAREPALGLWRDAIVIDPSVAAYYDGLGRGLIARRRDAQARSAFATAVRLEPADAGYRLRLAQSIDRLGDVPGAMEAYRHALALDAGLGRAHARLAVLSYYAGDDAGAWTHVRRAEALGDAVPAQMRRMLSARTPAPAND